ncbi:MAG: hypothetical protein LUG23_03965 [Oscillospiraceae bacterium]|nr:hypothetical protein [Oscillospiraceae bacterium]
MKLSDDYKSELSRLTLSEDFKAKLKEQCIAEAGLDKATEAEEEKTPEIQESKSDKIYKQMKIYRYVAIVACVVAAVSIVGGASIMSSVFSTSTRSSDSANEEMMELYDTDTDWEDDPVEDTDTTEIWEDDELWVEDTNADSEEIDAEYEEESDEAVEDPVEDTSLSSSVTSANPASSYTPDDYDGEYNTEDYVLGGSNTSASNTATLYGGLGTSEYGTASSFYDVLYNQMGDESETIGVSLVWITITGTPSSSGVPSPSGDDYTLYSATITYDYLNAVSCDIDIYVWIKGTEDKQVKGMPTYEVGDELIVSLMLGDNGCITVVDELIYDAYTLNGVDIVYHRVYGNVNPGSTDMGILPSEEEYYTTTSNNSAIYVHKASARELTRYIRRKVTGEGYNIADLEKISQYSMGLVSYSTFADNSSSEEETETSSDAKATLSINAGSSTSYFDLTAAGETIWLNDEASAVRLGELYSGSMTGTTTRTGISSVLFVGGHLRFSSETPFTGGVTEIEITSSGCSLDIKFRGIAVGDTLDEVKEKLSTSSVAVTDENLADDCVITINSDYGTVTLTVEYGVLAKIEIIA